jgi:hypothetical protein
MEWQDNCITKRKKDFMKLTVKYTTGKTEVFIDMPSNIEALIKELRNNKSTYIWYMVEK